MTRPEDHSETTRPGPEDAPSLLSDLLGHVSNLVRHEIALAKAEISASLGKAGFGIALLGVAALICLAALNLLAAASVAGVMALGLGWGWAALVAAAVWAVVAGVLVLWGRSVLSAKSLAPHRSFASMRKDAHVFKELTDG